MLGGPLKNKLLFLFEEKLNRYVFDWFFEKNLFSNFIFNAGFDLKTDTLKSLQEKQESNFSWKWVEVSSHTSCLWSSNTLSKFKNKGSIKTDNKKVAANRR